MANEKQADESMETPLHFRCPISMEIMKDPVIISTGVTYERKSIEKWFFKYNKKTCPATMQTIHNFDLTPNLTLKSLILSWHHQQSHHSQPSSPPAVSIKHHELVSLLTTIESTPFMVTSLKKLRAVIGFNDEVKDDFVQSGGVEVLTRIIVQILLVDTSDFTAFRACEEALAVLHQLSFSDEASIELLSKPECINSMAIMLQRGSAEARLHTVSIFRTMAKVEYNWTWVVEDQGIDLFKSLLELLSDEINTKASSSALDVLIEILNASKKNRLKAIEAGAVCVLIELLPDANRSKCEKILVLIKLLCECAEGRLALAEHRLGIAAVTKKILRVSDTATKYSVKIFWLICTSHPTNNVLKEMLVSGSVKKLLALLHMDGRSSTKDKALKMIKLHGNSWRRYPCFPCELKDYLRLLNDSS
ncbi:PREDICTED: E3 ubiquitin-protein ligase PUB23-like [Nelumbo nucifera]|uniref:U-box domain-containing protein n=2 Tax=Nelumbo nucifera TaxID=4432 RepID=A0A1U8AU44_NELNU|nr:PREDICTED: E3 ubiquitin-protein ligase PUB23-like [Nelumbo nucifera]DAD47526.1 TPA_asm: hypothetical protein HUJ06_017463 [Nelumbo nucifera]